MMMPKSIYPQLSPVTSPRLMSTQLINQLASQYSNVIVDLLKVSVLYLTSFLSPVIITSQECQVTWIGFHLFGCPTLLLTILFFIDLLHCVRLSYSEPDYLLLDLMFTVFGIFSMRSSTTSSPFANFFWRFCKLTKTSNTSQSWFFAKSLTPLSTSGFCTVFCIFLFCWRLCENETLDFVWIFLSFQFRLIKDEQVLFVISYADSLSFCPYHEPSAITSMSLWERLWNGKGNVVILFFNFWAIK